GYMLAVCGAIVFAPFLDRLHIGNPGRKRGARRSASPPVHRDVVVVPGHGVYHGSGLPSRKKPPVGPLSGSVAAHTTPAAPSATARPPPPPLAGATPPGPAALP